MRGNYVKLLKRFCSGVMKWSRLTDDEPGEFNNFFIFYPRSIYIRWL